jgi:hypothetical protein
MSSPQRRNFITLQMAGQNAVTYQCFQQLSENQINGTENTNSVAEFVAAGNNQGSI